MKVSDFANHPLWGWIPTKLIIDKDEVRCRWIYTKDFTYNLPFFDEALVKFTRICENNIGPKAFSTIDLLPEWSEEIPVIAPNAVIFHVSRCGSTLISQLLGLNPKHISLSEVPIFDEILRLRNKSILIGDEEISSILGAAIKFYSAKRNMDEERLFIKTDSWHLFFYLQYRRLFPDTPFIIMYRQPGEVLDSNKRKRGLQGVPSMVAPSVYGLDASATYCLHPDTYMAMVLEKMFEAILDIAQTDRRTLLVNYNEGPMAMAEKIFRFCGLNPDVEERRLIAQRTQYDAKYPDQKYMELNVAKNDSANAERLLDLYGQVDLLRLGQKL